MDTTAPRNSAGKAFLTGCGMHLRSIRKQRELTQRQVARLAGIPQNGVSRVEAGLSFRHLELVAAALHVPYSDVVMAGATAVDDTDAEQAA